jgi:hypothetical protein
MAVFRFSATVLAIGVLINLAAAQESAFRPVSNPFQDGFAYRVGDELAPDVDIEGVRWTQLRVAPRGDREIEADQSMAINTELEFDSALDHSVTALVVVLLQDEQGTPLDRLQCDPFRIAGGRLKKERQRFTVSGRALLATRSVYIFCELQ